MLMNLPICNLTFSWTIERFLAPTAFLEFFRIFLVFPTIYSSFQLSSLTLTTMNRTNSCCINEMEQLILMSLVEIRFTSISQSIQNHTNYWHTHKTREFQESHTSDIATHHPKCSVDSLSPSAISQSHSSLTCFLIMMTKCLYISSSFCWIW